MIERPAVPLTQRVFGEVVYWITVLCAIICIAGPIVAFSDMDDNVLNPHFLMENIFDGMTPTFEEQVLESDASAGDRVLHVEDSEKFADPEDVDRDVQIRVYDGSNSETIILESIDGDNDTLTLVSALSNSYEAGEETEVTEVTIWDDAKDDVEGGHFWKDHLGTGDGITQAGLALGCAVGFFAMIAAGLLYAFKEKSFGWALGAFWIAFMIAISVVGLVSVH